MCIRIHIFIYFIYDIYCWWFVLQSGNIAPTQIGVALAPQAETYVFLLDICIQHVHHVSPENNPTKTAKTTKDGRLLRALFP